MLVPFDDSSCAEMTHFTFKMKLSPQHDVHKCAFWFFSFLHLCLDSLSLLSFVLFFCLSQLDCGEAEEQRQLKALLRWRRLSDELQNSEEELQVLRYGWPCLSLSVCLSLCFPSPLIFQSLNSYTLITSHHLHIQQTTIEQVHI